MSDPKINQAHGVPKIPGKSGFSLRRSAFLNGDVRCYFGPGQNANASPDQGVIGDARLANHLVTLPYQEPTDWPKAGMLLRVPQVVFLSSLCPGPNILDQTETDANFTVGGNVPSEAPFTHEPRTVFYVYGSSVPNLYRIEADRLAGVFGDAKTTIEGLRPGRTFVEILDWQGPGGDRAFYYTASRYSHMLAPASSESGYFGLNFLNIYAGHFAWDGPGPSPTRAMWYDIDDSGLDDPAYAISRDRIETAYPLFAGYRTALYGPVFDWSAAATSALTLLSISKSQGAAITQEDRDNALASAQAKQPTFAATVWPHRDSLSVDMLTATADDLADHGFTYEGATSELTSASLVALIADHYGFDPDTGKDVG